MPFEQHYYNKWEQDNEDDLSDEEFEKIFGKKNNGQLEEEPEAVIENAK